MTVVPRGFVGQEEGGIALWESRFLVAGGSDGRSAPIADCAYYERYDEAWVVTGSLAEARRLHSMTRLADGRVLVAGGMAGRPAPTVPALASAEVYEPGGGTWSKTIGTMNQARWAHTSTLLPNGKVLVTGGEAARSPQSRHALRSAELYDPISGTWTLTTPMTDARLGHTAVLLPDGRVLVVGGMVGVADYLSAGMAFCELYDPVTETWTPTGSLHTPRSAHQTTLLQDGTVLVTGGRPDGGNGVLSPASLASTELYDPARGQWARAENMPEGRSFHRAVDFYGQVLVIGGTSTSSVGYQSMAVYEPHTRTWSPGWSMGVGRWGLATAILEDMLLVAGGIERAGAASPGVDVVTASMETFYT